MKAKMLTRRLSNRRYHAMCARPGRWMRWGRFYVQALKCEVARCGDDFEARYNLWNVWGTK